MQTATGIEWRKYGEPFTMIEIDLKQGQGVRAGSNQAKTCGERTSRGER